jgi:hypothetical protein
MLCAPGIVLTGASLIALTVMLTVSLSVSRRPCRCCPRSLVAIARLAAPLKSASA